MKLKYCPYHFHKMEQSVEFAKMCCFYEEIRASRQSNLQKVQCTLTSRRGLNWGEDRARQYRMEKTDKLITVADDKLQNVLK